MSLLAGSQYFTTSPPVAMAPCAPIDPVRDRIFTVTVRTTVKIDGRKIPLTRLKNQQKEAPKVDPLSFHALTFNHS